MIDAYRIPKGNVADARVPVRGNLCVAPLRASLPLHQSKGFLSRLRRVIALHFDPIDGSSFWLERARVLGIDARREIRSFEGLELLGSTTIHDLRSHPLLHYIPRALHRSMPDLTVAQTGGTTGDGTWTAYRQSEFREAFVDPFVSAAAAMGFPRGLQWLFIGPSGPHVIGKVVKHLAAEFNSPEPFAVDFDPRWAKKLAKGSFAAKRYLTHVVEQAMRVICTQQIGVLFTTPPVLAELGKTMTINQRRQIRAVHYGGMAIESEKLLRFQSDIFPEALHLAGYGNTLFGCCLELCNHPERTLDYFPHGNRLVLEVVDENMKPLPAGSRGRIRFTRLDETMLIVQMLERDVGTLIQCPTTAPAGFTLPGVRGPHTPETIVPQAASGLY